MFDLIEIELTEVGEWRNRAATASSCIFWTWL